MEPMSSALPGHSEPPQPMANWMGNVVLGHASVAAPSTIAQLQQTVRAALPPLRVLGSGHSFTPLCHCDGGGTLVSLRNLRRVWDLRPGTGSDGAASVVCEGGATFTDVIRHLRGSGCALPNLPSLPHVTVAGAIATGTHGSGLQPGMEATISSFVLDITFVTHDGSLATYSRQDSDDRLFRSCMVHLGALGPVASVRLRLVPDYSMQVYAFRGKCLPYILEHYRELAASCHSFTLGLNFATGECTTWIRHKLQSPLASESQNAGVPEPPADSAMLGTALAHAVPFHELGPHVPGVKTTRIAAWHDALTWFMDSGEERPMPSPLLQSEFFVPLDRASEALEAVSQESSKWPGWLHSETAKGTKYESCPLVFHCEVRVVARDSIARGMSPFSDRDSCCIHFTWGSLETLPELPPLLKALENVLRPFNPRPHYGKLVFGSFQSHSLADSLPVDSLDQFAAIVDIHDPTGPFFSISPQQAYSQFSVLQNVNTYKLTITLQGKNFKINGSKKC